MTPLLIAGTLCALAGVASYLYGVMHPHHRIRFKVLGRVLLFVVWLMAYGVMTHYDAQDLDNDRNINCIAGYETAEVR